MRVVTFKCDEALLEKLDMIARATKKSRSEIIREALERYVLDYYKTANNGTIRSRRLRVFVQHEAPLHHYHGGGDLGGPLVPGQSGGTEGGG